MPRLEDTYDWVCEHDPVAAHVADESPEVARMRYCCQCGQRRRHIAAWRVEKGTCVTGKPATPPHLQDQQDLWPGEAATVAAVITAARVYGFGNLIAHLKRAWAEHLIEKHQFSKEEALRAADTDAYPPRDRPGPVLSGRPNPLQAMLRIAGVDVPVSLIPQSEPEHGVQDNKDLPVPARLEIFLTEADRAKIKVALEARSTKSPG